MSCGRIVKSIPYEWDGSYACFDLMLMNRCVKTCSNKFSVIGEHIYPPKKQLKELRVGR